MEGGGVPALTQSSAGGIYDIPLATAQITTGGAITLTDDREMCMFSTVPGDGSMETSHFIAESADLTARQTRTKRLFIGGGDLKPTLNTTENFGYTEIGGSRDIVTNSASIWGSTVLSQEGWLHTDYDRGVQAIFKVPDDYASGDLTFYIWWLSDSAAATVSASFKAGIQIVHDRVKNPYCPGWPYYSCFGDLYMVSDSAAPGTMSRLLLAGLYMSPTAHSVVTKNSLIHCFIENSYQAGGDIIIVGLEIEYTGYL